MTAWIIGILVFLWFIVPAFLIISACMHSSRLSQAEEAARIASSGFPAYQISRQLSQSSRVEVSKALDPVRMAAPLGDGMD
jgi:hypothetical protein